MKRKRMARAVIGVLAVGTIGCALGCSGSQDFSANDTQPKTPASTTGAHSPPPMTRKMSTQQTPAKPQSQ